MRIEQGRVTLEYLEQALAWCALFFTIVLLEAIAIEKLFDGPLTTHYWRRIKNRRR